MSITLAILVLRVLPEEAKRQSKKEPEKCLVLQSQKVQQAEQELIYCFTHSGVNSTLLGENWHIL